MSGELRENRDTKLDNLRRMTDDSNENFSKDQTSHKRTICKPVWITSILNVSLNINIHTLLKCICKSINK